MKTSVKKNRVEDEELTLEDVVQLGGDQSDIDFLNSVNECDEDDPQTDSITKSEVENFIVQLGIRKLSSTSKTNEKQQQTSKRKLKSMKTNDDDDDEGTVCEPPVDAIADGGQPQTPSECSERQKKKKASKLVQHREVSSTTSKSADLICTYKPRKYLLIKPGGHWYNERYDSEPTQYQVVTTETVDMLQKFANRLLCDETSLYRQQQEGRKKSSATWMKTVLSSGTAADKTAALVLQVQEAPIHSLPSVDALMAMVTKAGHRRDVLRTLDTVKDLFLSDLLLEHGKLRSFEQHPLSELYQLSSGSRDVHDRRLILWYYESELKKRYVELVNTLEKLGHDCIDAARRKATGAVFQLLSERAEQEQRLLSLLVNKLGDPNYKVAANAAHLLTKLVDMHPNMKSVVVTELERLLYRPHISAKAQYYGVCFLNTLLLSHDERPLASHLLTIYFTFFKVYVKKGEVESKMLSALLTGVNRAYPYAKADRQTVLSHVDTLYKIVYISPFNTSLHALMLIHQVIDISDSTADRYFMALYRKLNDPVLQSSNKVAMFLNLLFKSMKNDHMDRRVQAFIKRLLQVCCVFAPPLICACLILLSEVLKSRPSLLTLTTLCQELDDADDEHFVDVDDDDSDKATDSQSTGVPSATPSWIHRNNATCRPGTYDAQHRNPLYCHADTECVWELIGLTRHYHPSVVVFAQTLLRGEHISYDGDPLTDFTLMRFLDRFVYRNPKKSKSAIETSASRQFSRTALRGVAGRLNIPVNSDSFVLQDQHDVHPDERFFYRYFSQQAARGKQRADDVDSDADDVSDDEFDVFLDKFEQGLEAPDINVDFASDLRPSKSTGRKKTKHADDEMTSSSDDDDDLSDEEVEFGTDDVDLKMDMNDLTDDDDDLAENDVEFDEEEIKFSDEDVSVAKSDKKRKLRSKQSRCAATTGDVFAAADEFSHLLEQDVGSSLGSLIGSSAVSRHDNAGAKQLKWEAEHLSTSSHKRRRTQHKMRSKSNPRLVSKRHGCGGTRRRTKRHL